MTDRLLRRKNCVCHLCVQKNSEGRGKNNSSSNEPKLVKHIVKWALISLMPPLRFIHCDLLNFVF